MQLPLSSEIRFRHSSCFVDYLKERCRGIEWITNTTKEFS